MTVAQTTRFGVYTWTSGTDTFTRSQMTTSHQNIEDRGAVFLTGSTGSYAASTYVRTFIYDSSTGLIYFSNGTTWIALNQFGTGTTANTPGNSVSHGSSIQYARTDHQHSMPSFGAVGDIAQVGTSAAAGSTAKFADAGHVHVLANNSVTAGKIATGGVSSTAMFASGVVDSAAIASGAVTKTKIATDQQLPAGIIVPFGGTVAPTGWLLCDGSSVLQASYSDLYAAIGTRYGGSGASFTLPDLRDRHARGATSASAAVTTGGADNVTLVANNIPAHSHAVGTIAVADHADHVHLLNGVSAGATSTNIAHTHSTPSHDHAITTSGYVNSGNNGTVGNGTSILAVGSYGNAVGLLAGANTPGVTSVFVTETQGSLSNPSGNVNYLKAEITSSGGGTSGPMSANASHTHSLTGSTAGVTAPALSHTVSGSTANNTTTGAAVDIRPVFTTVNYIIKT